MLDGLMRRQWKKEGPGTPAPRSGAALYLYVLRTYFWRFLGMNLLFFLCCLPLVTIPAALTAQNRVWIKLVREGNVLFWEEYRDEFRRSFGKSLLMGLLFGGFLFAGYYLLSLGMSNGENLYGLLFSALGFFLSVLTGVWGGYAFVLAASLELPAGTLLRNAWYLMLLGGRTTLAVLGAVLAGWGIPLFFFPVSLLLLVLGWPAFLAFTLCWLVNGPMDAYIVRPYEESQRNSKGEET